MRGEVGRDGHRRDRGIHRKLLGTHCKRHHRRANEYNRTGVGKWKDRSESSGGGQKAIPGRWTGG